MIKRVELRRRRRACILIDAGIEFSWLRRLHLVPLECFSPLQGPELNKRTLLQSTAMRRTLISRDLAGKYEVVNTLCLCRADKPTLSRPEIQASMHSIPPFNRICKEVR
jgi:hypothetical protein